MPHTKSKGQTRRRGATIPSRKTTRKVSAQRGQRTAARRSTRELPLSGSNRIPANARKQSEGDYAGANARAFQVARGKRLAGNTRTTEPGQRLRNNARNSGKLPTKVAASTGKARSRIGRTRRG